MQINKMISLKEFTSFCIGGSVKYLWCAENIFELIKLSKNLNKPIIFGGGTNILINDETTFENAICLTKYYNGIEVDGDFLYVAAGSKTVDVVNKATENLLTGAEFLFGIPGLFGGAVVMNAGAKGRSISEVVVSVRVVYIGGEVRVFTKEQLKFSRRFSILQNKKAVVDLIKIKLKKSSKEDIESKIEFYKNARKDLPKGKSAGGVFVNHCELKKYNLEGLSVGDAYLSGNFIINKGKATSKDVIRLIEKIRESVKERLNLEIKLIGFGGV